MFLWKDKQRASRRGKCFCMLVVKVHWQEDQKFPMSIFISLGHREKILSKRKRRRRGERRVRHTCRALQPVCRKQLNWPAPTGPFRTDLTSLSRGFQLKALSGLLTVKVSTIMIASSSFNYCLNGLDGRGMRECWQQLGLSVTFSSSSSSSSLGERRRRRRKLVCLETCARLEIPQDRSVKSRAPPRAPSLRKSQFHSFVSLKEEEKSGRWLAESRHWRITVVFFLF